MVSVQNSRWHFQAPVTTDQMLRPIDSEIVQVSGDPVGSGALNAINLDLMVLIYLWLR